MTDTSSLPPTSDDLAIDAEFEPAAVSAPSKGSQIQLRWAVIAGVGLVVITTFFWAAIASGLVPGLNSAAQNRSALIADNQDLQAQLNAAETDRADLSARLQAMEGRAAEQAASAQADRRVIADLNATIANFPRELAELRTDIETLQAQPALTPTIDPDSGEAIVAAINPLLLSRIEALERTITSFPAIGPDASLRADLTALQQSVQALATQPQAGTAPTRSNTDIALALSAIEAAARRGRPFQSGYQRLAAALPGDSAVSALQPIAATGALTLSDLRDQFAALESQALDTEAANAGGATNLMRTIFGDGVKVRRAGQDNAADRLDRARDKLANGNLRAAITEIEALPSAVQSVFTDWLDNAHRRQSLEDALEALRLAMIARDRP